MKTKLSKAFGDYPSGKKNPLEFPEVDYQYRHSINFVNKPDVNQSMIMMGHIGGYRKNPDYAAIQVMNNVLSGGFSGRLLQKIRTEMGLSYSPHGQFGMNAFYPGKFYVSVRTKSSSTAEVIKAVKEVIHNLQKEKISTDELKDAKDQFLNSLVFRYDSHDEVLQRKMNQDYKGLPQNVFERFVDSLKAVTRSDVQRVAREYLKPEKMQILVVGNKDQIGNQLKQFGNVRNIDISIPAPGESQKEKQRVSGDLKQGKKWLSQMKNAILKKNQPVNKITTKRTTTRFNSRLPNGKMQLKATSTIDYPDQVKTVLNTPKGKMTIQLKNGKATRKFRGRKQNLPARAVRQMKKELKRSYINIAMSSDTLEARYQGKTKLNDGKTYVTIQIPLDPAVTLHLDPETALPHVIEYTEFDPKAGKQQHIRKKLSDWQTHNGVSVAHKQHSFTGDKKVTESRISNVEITLK